MKVDVGNGKRTIDGMYLVKIASKRKKKSENKSDIKGAKSSLFLFKIQLANYHCVYVYCGILVL